MVRTRLELVSTVDGKLEIVRITSKGKNNLAETLLITSINSE